MVCRKAEGDRWQNQIAASMRRLTNLNESQKRAVATAISRRLTLWQVWTCFALAYVA